MNNQLIRQNRIKSLFDYAMSLRHVEGMTIDKIKAMVQKKAETQVTKQTAKEYTDSVFQMIQRLQKQ